MSLTRHNGKKRPIYRVWESMVGRCRDKGHTAYPKYGGRGITVAPEWTGRGGFARFLAHVGPRPSRRHTLERIRNNEGYKSGNVRWATWREQALNKRNSLLATINGQTRNVMDWCDRLQIVSWNAAYGRIKRGWSPAQAVLTPLYQRKPIVI